MLTQRYVFGGQSCGFGAESTCKFFSYMWPLVFRNVEHIHHLLFLSFILDTVMSAGPLFISLFDFVIVKHVTIGY